MTPTPTYTAQIYIAGDLDTARRVCREFVWQIGECVTIEPVEYIYKGGAETGVRVGFINYPRFPQPEAEIWDRAWTLAERLLDALRQWSFTIVATDRTVFFSRRDTKE